MDQVTKEHKRLEYIDALRGFTMILVVFHHVIGHLFYSESAINDLFITFRMPLFFFISGFMSYTTYSPDLIKKRLKNRLLGQLLPTIVTCTLFISLFSIPIKDTLMDPQKSGYWFTIAMVEIFLIFILAILIINKLHFSKKSQCILFCCISAMAYLVKAILNNYGLFGNTLVCLLSISKILQFIPFFFMGIIAKMYSTQFLSLIKKEYFMTVCIIGFIFFVYSESFSSSSMAGFLGIIIFFRLFEKYQDYLSSNTVLGFSLGYIGKRTLEIYLFHYFIISSLKSSSGTFQNYLTGAWIDDIIIYLPLTLLVISLCLLFDTVIKIAPPIHSLMFGFKAKKTLK